MEVKTLSQEERMARALDYRFLLYHCDENMFSFPDTSHLPDRPTGIIGQEKAAHAMRFGLAIEAVGYNLFLVGPPGTGKTTYALQMVQEVAKAKEVPPDWCYVYNFEHPDRPKALSLPAGQGVRFRSAVERLMAEVEAELSRAFESEAYLTQRNRLMREFEERAEQLWRQLEEEARYQGMALERTATGIVTIPLKRDWTPYTPKELAALDELQKRVLLSKQRSVDEKVQETMRQILGYQKEAKKKQRELDEKTAAYAVEPLFREVMEEFPCAGVETYLKQVQRDVIQHLDLFRRSSLEGSSKEEPQGWLPVSHQEQWRTRYQVNVVVDNQGLSGAPVVMENHPTYYNLMGKKEYRGSFGQLTTDFTLIKPGALHRANGGYLILQASDLLSQPNAWKGLLRALQTGEIAIEALAEEAGLPTTGLRPEPIPLQVKVLLIGTAEVYQMLYQLDEAFRKMFKVKVEFDWVMERNEENCQKYAQFIAAFARRNQLPPFSRGAVAEVINFSIREAGHRNKLSTRFHKVTEILVEAAFLARQEGQPRVEAHHVKEAIRERFLRSNQLAEKAVEVFREGTLMVETEGERIGQVNGLAVFNSGDLLFGQPHRITARTFAGHRGVINIERETAMSGSIHDKGVLILAAYLSGEFAQKRPFSVNATIVFEQTYQRIDGDSASSAELFALLSSLAQLPVKQGIAVTGSVNQWGEIQAIGGVNEKIQGFFDVCKAKGLTGEQGVVIPAANVPHVLLSDEVLEAVRQGLFHIWPIRTVKEGIEILTGVVAGSPEEEGTVYHRVYRRLEKVGVREEGSPKEEVQLA